MRDECDLSTDAAKQQQDYSGLFSWPLQSTTPAWNLEIPPIRQYFNDPFEASVLEPRPLGFDDSVLEPRPICSVPPPPAEQSLEPNCEADYESIFEPTPCGSVCSSDILSDCLDQALTELQEEQTASESFGSDFLMYTSPFTPKSTISQSSNLTTNSTMDSPRGGLQQNKRQGVDPTIGSHVQGSARFNARQNLLWMDQFQKLKNFKKGRGHCHVPITYPQDPVLARWVKRQRYHYKRMQDGKPSAIDDARIQMLEAIGFVWDAHASGWQEKFDALAEFKRRTGHCRIQSSHPKYSQLSAWIKSQRRQYRALKAGGEASHMSQERIEALESLGFKWAT
eukprot:scaffold1228_cov119-Cylindrotheca_fusiformis.AAC.15